MKSKMIGQLQAPSKDIRIACMFGMVEALVDTNNLDTSIVYEVNELTPIDIDLFTTMIENRQHAIRVKSVHVGYKTEDDAILPICNDLKPYYDIAYERRKVCNIGYNGCKVFIKERRNG